MPASVTPDPPLREAITDVNGNITRPWYQFWKGAKDTAVSADAVSVLGLFDDPGKDNSVAAAIDAAMLYGDPQIPARPEIAPDTVFGPSPQETPSIDPFHQGYLGEEDERLSSIIGYVSMLADQQQIPAVIPPTLYEDTHANRLTTYAPANYPLTTLFRETDRNAIYEVQLVTGSNAWVYLPWAPMFGTTVSTDQRPAGLGTADTGFLFVSTDGLVTYEWIGTAWQITSGVMQGLDASKPATLTANDAGFPYFATDTSIFYVWSGTAWNGTSATSAAPPTFWFFNNSTLTLGSSFAGAATSGSLPKAGKWAFRATAQLNVIGSGDAGQQLQAQMVLGISAVGLPFYVKGADGTSDAVTLDAVISGVTLGQVLTIDVKKSGGSGSSTCTAATISGVWIS